MPWATSSESRIAIVLGVPQTQIGLSVVVGGMNAISALPSNQEQPAVAEVERLLGLWETTDLAISEAAGKAGLIKADVLGWSDRAGARTESLEKRQQEIATRIATALGLKYPFSLDSLLGSGCGGNGRRGRS